MIKPSLFADQEREAKLNELGVLRKAFGARLKVLRKQKNWAQKELAAKVEVRFQQLNKYESGLNIPPAEMLIKLADALDVTVDFLLTGNPIEDSPLTSSRLFAVV